jgi:hypothetical protein
VKKDILAAFTFILTGLLFYVVQADVKTNEILIPGMECEGMVGSVIVEQNSGDALPQITLENEGTRDS